MLKYFVMTVETLVLAAVLTGALRGFIKLIKERFGAYAGGIGAGVGFVAAAVMA